MKINIVDIKIVKFSNSGITGGDMGLLTNRVKRGKEKKGNGEENKKNSRREGEKSKL